MLTEDRIKQVLSKDIKTKTMLVNKEEIKKVIEEHSKDGWKIFSQSEVGEKVKITFQKY